MLTLTLTWRHVLHLTASTARPPPRCSHQGAPRCDKGTGKYGSVLQGGGPSVADRSAHSPAPPSFFSLSSYSCHTFCQPNTTEVRYPGQQNQEGRGTCCSSRVLMDFPRRAAHMAPTAVSKEGAAPPSRVKHIFCQVIKKWGASVLPFIFVRGACWYHCP